MLRSSFMFLDRIGRKRERQIKDSARDWKEFLGQEKIAGMSRRTKHFYDRKINEGIRALKDRDSSYFLKMPSDDSWMLYEEFRDEAVFLDIETSGPGMKSFLTVIGLFDGYQTKTMVKDLNLDLKALSEELHRYRLIVTFNGSSFDIPFLNKRHPGLLPDIPHFDLRHACASIGLIGGLKHVEAELGIRRQNFIVDKMYEGNPIDLWRRWRSTGDRYYLDLLVEYNEEDVINLKKIAQHVVKEKKKGYFIFE